MVLVFGAGGGVRKTGIALGPMFMLQGVELGSHPSRRSPPQMGPQPPWQGSECPGLRLS